MKAPPTVAGAQPATAQVEKKNINAALWQACAGPLVDLPAAGTQVVYFPQGHSEQVASSLKKNIDGQIPNHPNLPSKLLCILHNITLHADPETDEVYAQMTLQPTPSFDKDALLRSDLSMKINKPQTEFFCKILTASDTSTHGGFSVPRRAAEKIFPTLDFTMLPPVQELVARDLHDNVWKFRHIYRGQPKRHLLTTGWSHFVSGKRLFAGDLVLFIRDEKQQLLLGIRRANRQPMNLLSSSVLSSDSMHIGILAAAAHAAANNSPFTVFYNPRATPSEFVIPLAKYYRATCSNQVSLGMRFRMVFETEESGTRRYMGTITGISDLDPVGWKNSQWRNLQVGWDEPTAGERRTRVSLWEIEPMKAPFFLCPTPPLFSLRCPRLPGMADDYSSDADMLFRRTVPWLGDDFGLKDSQWEPGMSLAQWMSTQQNPPGPNSVQLSSSSSVSQSLTGSNNLHQLGLPENRINSQMQLNHIGSIIQPQQQNDMQSVLSDHANHQLHVPGNEIQQLQHLQQSLLSQQLAVQQQFQDNHQVIDAPQFHPVAQQMVMNDIQTNIHFAQTTPQLKQVVPESPVCKGHSRNGSTGAASGSQSAVTDDVPSRTASPSTNNCTGGSPPLMNGRNLCTAKTADETVLSSGVLSNTCGSEAISSNGNIGKGFHHKSDVRPSLNVSQDQSQSVFASPVLTNPSENQIDYLDSSSSATSVLSKNEAWIPDGNTLDMPFDSQSLLFRDVVQGGSGSNAPFGASIDDQMGPMLPDSFRKDFPTNLSSEGGMLSGNKNTGQLQPELLSSMISQPFGVGNTAFNSVNSTMNDGSFMNSGSWAPPQIPRMRTFTKVYKRGAVGRSVDILSYSGYDELKQDLAHRFGIQGQFEDWQRIGWKLVYVDHENDVLLVGDDPWEEFVNCVRCIKILSPQEVQQMSLAGDIGNNGFIPSQACCNLDNGVS